MTELDAHLHTRQPQSTQKNSSGRESRHSLFLVYWHACHVCIILSIVSHRLEGGLDLLGGLGAVVESHPAVGDGVSAHGLQQNQRKKGGTVPGWGGAPVSSTVEGDTWPTVERRSSYRVRTFSLRNQDRVATYRCTTKTLISEAKLAAGKGFQSQMDPRNRPPDTRPRPRPTPERTRFEPSVSLPAQDSLLQFLARSD